MVERGPFRSAWREGRQAAREVDRFLMGSKRVAAMSRRAAFTNRPGGRMVERGPFRSAWREGRQAAREVDRFLMGSSELPR